MLSRPSTRTSQHPPNTAHHADYTSAPYRSIAIPSALCQPPDACCGELQYSISSHFKLTLMKLCVGKADMIFKVCLCGEAHLCSLLNWRKRGLRQLHNIHASADLPRDYPRKRPNVLNVALLTLCRSLQLRITNLIQRHNRLMTLSRCCLLMLIT